MKNKINKALEQTNATLINFIIGGIGILCLLAAIIFADRQTLRNILLSIGCSLIASSVVSFLTSKYLVRSTRVKKVIDFWGLEGIYETRQEMNRSSDRAFGSLEKHLDIIAWGLKSFRDAKGEAIKEKIKTGLKIRIIAPYPDSEYVEQREKDENEVPGQIRNTILNLQAWVEELKQIAPDPSHVQIRYYKSLPEDFYFRSDDSVFVGAYLYGISSQQTISYEFKGTGRGATYYKDYFEKLWNDPVFCSQPGSLSE